ncbi:MAG TPA: hypothetical protein VGR26_00715 [Acidimicrobiales bacterium]|nr:hypothetical protein [Acidimicrobiales bacterium]
MATTKGAPAGELTRTPVMGRQIPARKTNRLLVATWNVANLGLQQRTDAWSPRCLSSEPGRPSFTAQR